MLPLLLSLLGLNSHSFRIDALFMALDNQARRRGDCKAQCCAGLCNFKGGSSRTPEGGGFGGAGVAALEVAEASATLGFAPLHLAWLSKAINRASTGHQ